MRKSFLLTILFGAFSLHAEEIVIRAARVIDGRGQVVSNAAVVTDGTKIVRIDPHPKHIDYDLGDRTLMPGGIDTNGRSNDDGTGEAPEEYALHAEENAWKTLMGGITTIQSLGAAIDKPLRDSRFARRRVAYRSS